MKSRVIFLGISGVLLTLAISGKFFSKSSPSTLQNKKHEAITKVERDLAARPIEQVQSLKIESKEKQKPINTESVDLQQRISPTFGGLISSGEIIATKENAVTADGSFQRITLVKTKFKYPLVKVFQKIAPDAEVKGGQRVVYESAVVADHVMVTLQDGQKKEDLEYMVSKLGGSIRGYKPVSKVYLVSFEIGDNLDSLDRFQNELSNQKDLIKKINKDYLGHI